MKGFALICAVMALLISTPAQSQVLYDDFTDPLLSSSRWFGNRQIGTNISNTLEFGQVTSKKKLDMFNHCFGSTADGNTGTRPCATRLAMQDGAAVVTMEALVQPIALEQSGCAQNSDGATWIRLGGAFFNSTPITGTVDGQNNDILAFISLERELDSSDPPGVMSITGSVYRCTDSTCSQTVLVTTTGAPNPIVLGTVNVKKKVQLRLTWDQTNNRFLFRQGKGNKALEQEIGYIVNENWPPGSSNGGFKRLEIRHGLANCTAGPTRGWARAYFDNFFVTRDN